LRKSLGKDAAAAGFSENDMAGGARPDDSSQHPAVQVEHSQRDAAEKVIRAIEKEGKR
jgi:hypothetical protein